MKNNQLATLNQATACNHNQPTTHTADSSERGESRALLTSTVLGQVWL